MSIKNVISKNGVWKTAPLNDSPSSGGGVLVVTDTNGTLDKTWQEIHDAFPMVRVEYVDGVSDSVASVAVEDESYCVYSFDGEAGTRYASDSASDYPRLA
jgi:hypothetical protein